MITRRGQETTKKLNFEPAKNLIKYLIEQDESIDFLYPVDPDKLGIPSYRKIIKNPMDICTIRTKIKNSKYETIEDTLKDIQLIWDNCRTFNKEESVIVLRANDLEKKCRKYCEDNKIEWVCENILRKSSNNVELPIKRKRQGIKILCIEKSDIENEKEDFDKIEFQNDTEKKEYIDRIDDFFERIDRDNMFEIENNRKKVKINVMKPEINDKGIEKKNSFKSKNLHNKINIEDSKHKGQKGIKFKDIIKGKISLRAHYEMKTNKKNEEEKIEVIENNTKDMVNKGKINLKLRNDSSYKVNKINKKTIKIQNIVRYNNKKEGGIGTELKGKRGNKEIMIEKKIIEIESDSEAEIVKKIKFGNEIEGKKIGEIIEIESEESERDTYMQGCSLDYKN
ncbi:hypothetical protein SteCoe_19507 [Stentor coeruleus]|uniref:Bromo domain-containing protein n=1 Tax=Stentor coeruleus TaxID=5963 RepID=A0A1R2BU12_9CILI|nr:hypothetical protein SteCoe_19507 [Stentor coeruleus]